MLRVPQIRLPAQALSYAVLVGGEVVAKLLATVVFAYLARTLGAEAYGSLEFTLALVMILTLVIDAGLSPFGAREIARDDTVCARLTAQIFLLRLTLALVAAALLIGIAMVIAAPPPVKLLLALYGLPLLTTPTLVAFVFQGRGKMHWVAVATATRWLVFAAGVFVLVRTPQHMYVVALIEAAAILGAAAVYAVGLRRYGLTPRWDHSIVSAGSVLRQSLPIGLSELVWAAKIYFATTLLGLVVGGAEVGLFGAAHRLAIALHAFVWLYYFNLLPALSRSSPSSPTSSDELQHLVGTSLHLTIWAGLGLGILGGIFAETGIWIIYGPEYEAAAEIFKILVWFVTAALISGNYRYSLIAHGQQHLEFLAAAAGMALNVLLATVLIPTIGLRGAAIAMVVSEVLILVLAARFVRSTVVPIPLWRPLQRPLVLGAILAVVVPLVVPSSVWIGGAIAMLAICGAALTDRQLVVGLRAVLVRHG